MARTRPSGTNIRGGRKNSTTQPSSQTKNRATKQAVTKRKVERKRMSRGQKDLVPTKSQPSREAAPRGRKRKAQDAEVDELEAAVPETTKARKYTHLAPKTKMVPQEVIDTWPVISSSVLAQISEVLRRAKDTISLSRRDPQKREEADVALNSVVRQLERHFGKTKIPPQTKALHFDLDHLSIHNERVYREVTTARHRKQLLEEQMENATAKLKAEEGLANELKENAQQWRRRWKSQEKKQLHPLLQQSENIAVVDDRPDDVGLKRSAAINTALFDTPDSELTPLLEQLRRNLETMQGNHMQVEGIDEAVRDARAALDDVIFKHATAQQYDAL